MTTPQKRILGVLGYLVMGMLTARLATLVVGPASTADDAHTRAIVVGVLWPVALPIYLLIAAGRGAPA